MMFLKKIAILFVVFVAIIACKDDNRSENLQSFAREGIVNQLITDASLINTPLEHIVLANQGTRGVIVYNTGNTGAFQYRAFELSCPYTNCSEPMEVDNAGTLTCGGDCGDDTITFNAFKTSVTIDGETYHLVEYEARLTGAGLRIRNFAR